MVGLFLTNVRSFLYFLATVFLLNMLIVTVSLSWWLAFSQRTFFTSLDPDLKTCTNA